MVRNITFFITSGVGGFHVYVRDKNGDAVRAHFGPFRTEYAAREYTRKWAAIHQYETIEEN